MKIRTLFSLRPYVHQKYVRARVAKQNRLGESEQRTVAGACFVGVWLLCDTPHTDTTGKA